MKKFGTSKGSEGEKKPLADYDFKTDEEAVAWPRVERWKWHEADPDVRMTPVGRPSPDRLDRVRANGRPVTRRHRAVIYFIHDQTSRTIKIGCAWHPGQRLVTLQISTSNKLVLLGSIAGMKKAEKQVHGLVYRHCGTLGEPSARPLCVSGEWFDDRILPFVTELIASPNSCLEPDKKKTPRTRPTNGGLRNCGLVLTSDSGETFRESFILKAASPELALASLTNIADARLAFLAHTMRIARLVVPGCRATEVSLSGAFVTQNCNPREGLSVIVNSEPGNGFATRGGVKQYANRWLHGVPSELYEGARERWFLSRAYTRPTQQFVLLLAAFARVLEQNQCVITAQTPLPVRGLLPRGIGPLPRGELRSGANRKAAGKRRAPGQARLPKVGVVYFIQDEATTAVKIGFCLKKPEKRLAALKTGNPNPLRLVGHVPGSEAHEKGLHRLFSAFHLQGEWFSNAVLPDVYEILKCPPLEEWLKRQSTDPSPSAEGAPSAPGED